MEAMLSKRNVMGDGPATDSDAARDSNLSLDNKQNASVFSGYYHTFDLRFSPKHIFRIGPSIHGYPLNRRPDKSVVR